MLPNGNYRLSNIAPGSYPILVTPTGGSSAFGIGTVELQFASEVSLLAAMARSNPWQNPLNRFDVNASGTVSPIDVLLVINQLNLGNWREALPVPVPENNLYKAYFDVSNDGTVSPLDALLVINFLNTRANAEGEILSRTEPNTETSPINNYPIDNLIDSETFTTFWDDLVTDARRTKVQQSHHYRHANYKN